jgi:hypothetical protein
MPSPDSHEASSDPEVLAARGQVELAKAELENQLHRASETGREALGRMARKARPVLILTAVVVGVVFVTRLVKAARRKPTWTRAFEDMQPRQPSWIGMTATAALRGVLRAAAARLTEQAAARLLAASEAREDEEAEPVR